MNDTTKIQKIETWANQGRFRNLKKAMKDLGYDRDSRYDRKAFNLLLSRATRNHGVTVIRTTEKSLCFVR